MSPPSQLGSFWGGEHVSGVPARPCLAAFRVLFCSSSVVFFSFCGSVAVAALRMTVLIRLVETSRHNQKNGFFSFFPCLYCLFSSPCRPVFDQPWRKLMKSTPTFFFFLLLLMFFLSCCLSIYSVDYFEGVEGRGRGGGNHPGGRLIFFSLRPLLKEK